MKFDLPMYWVCVKCKRRFPNIPDGAQPIAVEIITDPKTGWQKQGGDICKECYEPK